MRHAVLLGRGKYLDEVAGFLSEDGPQSEFIAIAVATDARVFSLLSSEPQRGKWFTRLFAKKPHIGSALHFALSARLIDSCYVTGEDVGILAAIFLSLCGWKGQLYCVIHNITPKKASLLRLIGHKKFGGMIIVSERQRALLVEQCRIPAEKIFFRHNWVDDTFFDPAGNTTAAKDAQIVIMACGAENRDYAMLNNAATKLDMEFEVYGHGFFGNDLDGQGAARPANVHQMPRVSFPELARAYHRADAVVVPLNDVDYAAGVTGLVEAMACGKPVIVTKTTGLDGYLDAIEPTLLIRPGDAANAVAVFKQFAARSAADNAAAGSGNRQWILQNCALAEYAAFVRGLMERSGESTIAGRR